MLLYILLGVIVALGITVWFVTSDGEFVAGVVGFSTVLSVLVLSIFGLAARVENVESTHASSVTIMSNHSGDKGFAYVDGDNVVFKTEDGVQSVLYVHTRISEVGQAGVGEVVITEHRNTYGWILPWSSKGETTIVLYIPRGGLGVM